VIKAEQDLPESKGSFENSALKELANLKQVKSAGVLGKVANLIKRVIK